ncbi:sodium:solute symporter family transporter [Cerasicoccus arenae]|uniref:Transporter n=1 Tax=Cerasicoccus arenae TaxID=424488 RepID=A0A8J3DFA7_9BACT|nr:hypothetical protein [Cerasicoccus arenae]MBK1859285.1 hypothetical protein [Cerasicoccus arenae]GHC13327.1 transporter [Cerasicoccus arenae]
MTLNYITLVTYLVLLMVVGAVFSKMNKNVSDFARGGAQGTWWMVGTSMFMGGISAFTFTGNASAAFLSGPTFLVLYLANCVGLAICIVIGPWFRQTRAITWADVIKERFHVSVEQFSVYFSLILQPVGAATQLYALAIFMSAILGLPTSYFILGLGLIVVFYSTTGGRWAVMATDFVQGLVLFALTVLVFFLALHKVGGIESFFSYFSDPRFADDFKFVKSSGQFPEDKFTWKWIAVVFILQLQGYVNLNTVGRFLSAKDSRHARWAAIWACFLMLIGTLVWFLPPMVSRFLYSDEVMNLAIKEPATASYAVIAQHLLPNGLMGLMLAAMLGATMSSMDTGLNSVAGVVVNNIIPRLRKKSGKQPLNDKTNIRLCRLVTILLGVYIIFVSLLLALQKGLALFDAYLMIAAIVGLPLSMPMLLGLWIPKLHWKAYFIIIGAAITPSIYFVIRSSIFGEVWPIQDRLLWIYALSFLGVALSWRFWKHGTDAYKKQVQRFYEKMHRPVDFNKEIGESRDSEQCKILGWTTLILGSLIFLYLLAANSLSGRLQIAALGAFITSIGFILIYYSKRYKKGQ